MCVYGTSSCHVISGISLCHRFLAGKRMRKQRFTTMYTTIYDYVYDYIYNYVLYQRKSDIDDYTTSTTAQDDDGNLKIGTFWRGWLL